MVVAGRRLEGVRSVGAGNGVNSGQATAVPSRDQAPIFDKFVAWRSRFPPSGEAGSLPSAQVRKYRPTPSFFTSQQTLMP